MKHQKYVKKKVPLKEEIEKKENKVLKICKKLTNLQNTKTQK